MNDSWWFANFKAALARVKRSAGYLATLAFATPEPATSAAATRHKEGTVVPLIIFGALLFLILGGALPIWSQQSSHDEHEGMSMSANEPGPTDATLLSWKRESEGNHHLIGFLIALSGVFLLAQGAISKRFPLVAYVWPACFLLSGLFVLVYSDTELWPFGPKPWIQGTITNPEVIQHKIFAILLLVVGLIETERVRRHMTNAWLGWIFPVLAMSGSVLLLFHSHNAGMHGPDHMAVMARIQNQHFSYAATGFGIGLAKGFAEIDTKWQSVFARLWPILMIVLGVLLMRYVE